MAAITRIDYTLNLCDRFLGGWIGIGKSVDACKFRPKSADPQLFTDHYLQIEIHEIIFLKQYNPHSVSKIIQNP